MQNTNPKNSTEPFLTPQQAAEILNVSLSTLKKFIYSGKIKTLTTPGGHHRISKESLFQLAEQEDHLESVQLSSISEIAEGFMKVLENQFRFCRNHSSNVANVSSRIAQGLNFSQKKIHGLRLAATLHDIGKFWIDDTVLNKQTALTPEEYSLIKGHAARGSEAVNAIRPFRDLAGIVRQHHERFDGSGYPEGLKKGEIWIEARIIAMADTFDVMTSSSSYKDSVSADAALEEIKACAGTQFDPQLVEGFLSLSKE